MMRETHKTLFISDIHLVQERKDIKENFLNLLNACDQTVDSLYILGDLFELWVGDDLVTPFTREITDALRKIAQRGIKIYIMRGNRDFLLGKQFADAANATLLDDVLVATLYQQNVLLLHGDLLCTDDTNYQKSRRLMRNFLLQKLFLCLPLSMRQKIANKIRRSSEAHMRELPLYVMDVNQDAVLAYMTKYQCEFMVHGHTHQPMIHQYAQGNKSLTRIVLSSWENDPKILVWFDDGDKKLMGISEFINQRALT